MTEYIDGAQVVAAFERATARMIEIEDYLNRLDAAMGDGDAGITAAKGAAGVREFLQANTPGDDLGKFISNVGMTFNKTAPSTLAALTATACIRAGKEAKGLMQLDAPTLVRMLQAADLGIQERGKTKPGDKTMVDAIHPAVVAFADAVAKGKNLSEAGQELLQAAREGRDAAIALRSKVGRASWVGERTENQPDPGTVLFVQLVEVVLGVDFSEPGSTLK
jgi:phosphoenolpyruvate---glycerone phosphotransferase subunit DhaL